MAKRPSASSTRSKQHQVLRYIYSTDFKTAAKDYNVSPDKLRQFALGNPRRQSFRVIKDPELRRLYRTDVKKVAEKKNVKLIPRLSRKRYFELGKRAELTRREALSLEYRTVSKTREYERLKSGKVRYRRLSERQVQMQAVRKELLAKDLGEFTSKNAVKEGLRQGLLDTKDINTIVDLWAEKYNKQAEENWVSDMMDELLEGEVEEEEGE